MTWRMGLRGRLALSHALLALALVLAASFILERQSSRLQRSEAAAGAQRDAEVAARRSARALDRPEGLARVVADERGGRRDLEVVSAEGRVLDGTVPAAAAGLAREAAGDALDGVPSGRAIARRHVAVGAAPILHGDDVVGAAVLVEPATRLQPWVVTDRLAVLPGMVLVVVAAVAGWLIAGRLSRPIHDLTRTARLVALGALDAPLPGGRRGGPEVETLRAAVGRMVERTRSVAARAQQREHRQAVEVRRLSHQLRTPVSVLALRLEELAAPDTPVERRAHLGEVAGRQVTTLAALSSNLVDVARGTAAAEATLLDLGAVARRVTERLLPLARSARTRLDVCAGGPTMVRADPAAVDDAVTNVVENALKFTPPGGAVQVLVTTGAGEAVVEVADSGPGIPPAERDLVVLPWVRGAAGEAAPGTGLGLSLAADACSRDGGRLEIGDSPAGGALVRLVFPLAPPAPAH
ncbi:MAG TPA: HAMP domain-containing sensor histidine kinase [Acidimicrobiales bacterium]|nr:HAMP domain-containing sensor histidine kinase [Acidimicrobiales bacterium]